MLDRPPLADAVIAATLRDRYGAETTELDFLALGFDPGGEVDVALMPWESAGLSRRTRDPE